jgi:hypothetical protein
MFAGHSSRESSLQLVAAKCRLLSGLPDQTQFRVCIAAEDAYFNLQPNSTVLTFTTKDGSPPSFNVSATAQSESSPPGSINRKCSISVVVQLSEAGAGVVQILPADTKASEVTPTDILTPSAQQSAWLQNITLAHASFTITGQSGGKKTLAALPAPCETQLAVLAAASDTARNNAPNVAVVQVQTPDVLPPSFVLDTPHLSEATNTSATFEVALNEPGSCAFQVPNLVHWCISA